MTPLFRRCLGYLLVLDGSHLKSALAYLERLVREQLAQRNPR